MIADYIYRLCHARRQILLLTMSKIRHHDKRGLAMVSLESMMRSTDPHAARIVELQTMIAAYRQMTVEEADASDAGDREIEAEAELWRLEQELTLPATSRRTAA